MGQPGQTGRAARIEGQVGRVVQAARPVLSFAAVLSVLSVSAVHNAPLAQAKRPFTLVQLAELPRMFSPQLSPDGSTLAYFVSAADWKTNRLVLHMWRQPVGGAAQQLTFTEAGDIPVVRWSPDGRTLLFMREGQLWLMSADGGEPRALSRHATSVSAGPGQAPTWSPDGTFVFFLASDPRTAEERERDRVRDDVYAFDETFKHRRLWKIAVSTGVETQITSGDATILEYRLSADGSRLVYERAPSPADGDAYRAELWTADSDGANARALTDNGVQEFGLDISADGSRILFLADANDKFEPYFPTTLFAVPAAGGTAHQVVQDFPYTFDSAVWARDGRTMFASVNMGVHSEFYQVDAAARTARQLTDGRHYIAPGWSLAPAAERLVFQLDEPSRFGDVWSLPTRGAATPTRLTGLFDRLDRDLAVPRQEKTEWKAPDGTTIEGVLFYPLDYVRGRRYPLVVQLHGGPMESDKFGAGPGLVLNYVPVLAAKGYAVLRPNYRGSVGYGPLFFRDVVNGYFHNMATDVLSGVDHLVDSGVADPDRLIVMGFSAGGTLVNRLITLTDRFKAASSGAGVANWISLWAQTDNTSFRRTWFGGTPWQKNAPFDAFWGASPLKDIANAKTPTLLFAGEADLRVPMAQSIEMYRALRSLGVPTRLYVGPREGHGWSDLRHQVF
jgi:dipeptidyl aminopeptidase/acylaminoacyl peptidase